MADEDEIFQDAGRKLFVEGFTKKAKERDDELKSLAAPAGDRRKAPTSRPFFSPAVKPQRETSPSLQSQQWEATFWTTLRRRRRTTHGGDGINHHARR